MTDLTALIEALERAEGPRYVLDEQIDRLVSPEELRAVRPPPPYTSSIDAALTLVPEGFAWKLGSCCVSDDARLVPDYNSPEHGERLRREWGEPVKGSFGDVGIDIDLRPSGRPAIALCIACLKARQNAKAASPVKASGGVCDAVGVEEGELEMPVRIQRSRAKDWKMPDGAVYVGRPSKWGNPHKVGVSLCDNGDGRLRYMTPADAVTCYRDEYLPYWLGEGRLNLADLRGKNLACWCPLDQPCHADVLLELANQKLPRRGAQDAEGPVHSAIPD